MRRAPKIDLTSDELSVLEKLAIPNPRWNRISLRARIVLADANGHSNEEIARELGVQRQTVSRWLRRYLDRRLAGIVDAKPSLGRRPVQRWRHSKRILDATAFETPPNGRRWTCRSLASHLGVSVSLVQRVWKKAGLSGSWRRDSFATAPFLRQDRLRLLGCFFQSGQRAVVVEVLPNSLPNEPIGAADSCSIPLTIINVCPPPLNSRVGSRAGRGSLVQQQIKFLRDSQRQANSGSKLRLITDGEHSFGDPRVRRCISRSARFSVHYSSQSLELLSNAEKNCQTLTNQRFLRTLSAQLPSLAASETPSHVFPVVEVGLDFVPIGTVRSEFLASAIP